MNLEQGVAKEIAIEKTAKPEVEPTRSFLMRWKRWHFAIVIAVLAALFWVAGFIKEQRQPVYDGKRIGVWFDDLCLGTYMPELTIGRVERITNALMAFSKMDSNAIPFLQTKLTENSRILDTLILKGRTVPAVGPICSQIAPPSHQRLFAAFALRRLRIDLTASIPLLVQACSKEKDAGVKRHMLITLANAMGITYPESYQPPQLDAFEQKILKHAWDHYPHFFPSAPQTIRTQSLLIFEQQPLMLLIQLTS